MDFDIDGIMRQVRGLASDKIHSVLLEAKHELGDEGHDIQIEDKSSISGTGDQMEVAGVTFASEDVKERFLAIVHQKLN